MIWRDRVRGPAFFLPVGSSFRGGTRDGLVAIHGARLNPVAARSPISENPIDLAAVDLPHRHFEISGMTAILDGIRLGFRSGSLAIRGAWLNRVTARPQVSEHAIDFTPVDYPEGGPEVRAVVPLQGERIRPGNCLGHIGPAL